MPSDGGGGLRVEVGTARTQFALAMIGHSVRHPPSASIPVPSPLSLLPIALAAGNGCVDGTPAAALVAAGFTLLQRSAPLVRALAGRRSAILLPPSRAAITALAASDGRGAVVLDPFAHAPALGAQLREADVGAVFTTRATAAVLPVGERVTVLLDDAPRSATVVVSGTEARIDLGSHFGLDLEGEPEEGRDEECLVAFGARGGAAHTHRSLLAGARGAVDATSMLPHDHVLAALPLTELWAFLVSMAAPLLSGARVSTLPRFDAPTALRAIEEQGITMLAATPSTYEALAAALEQRGTPLSAPPLRVCLCGGAMATMPLQERWHALTGVELRQAWGCAEAPLCLFNVPHLPNRRGTAGIPFPGVRLSVRDALSHRPVPHGAPGELWVRGAQLFSGYVGSAPAGRCVIDGWLQTGTVAQERDDGAFALVPPANSVKAGVV